jgi:hypothetical protein
MGGMNKSGRGPDQPRVQRPWWVPIRPHQWIIGLLLVVAPLCLMAYKIHRAGYRLRTLAPVERYRVSLNMTFVGHGDSLRVRTFLPQQDARVTITSESQESELPAYMERPAGGNRMAEWSGQSVSGPNQIRVQYAVSATARSYHIDRDIPVPGPGALRAGPDLAGTPTIQVQDPEVAALAERLAPRGAPLIDGLREIQKFCEGLRNVAFKGETDALTALRLGEASCNGKSRLFVALARHQGIPARLVGGLILERGSKRTSHQWVEVQVGPYWVPFCPTNHYFGEVPIHYLELYRGDEVLFTHSSDINFDYRFHIREEMMPRKELVAQGKRDPLNLLSMWSTFHKAGIPDSLLKVLLMIPLGALVLVIFRNVIGLQTYGTFLPVLIAVASREIGLFWGVLVFLLIIVLVFCVRLLISRLNLLHMPQMAILLTVTIASILALAVVGVRAGNRNLSDVSMFPIAILAITTERLALMLEETGAVETLKMMGMTAVCIAGCYLVMNAATFQILFMSFPELVLIILFLDIWLGHWMGLRLTEYWRFRQLLAPGTRGR